MNSLLNFTKHLAIPAVLMLAIQFSAQAQNPVESTHIDEKYAFTTVVYKNTAATDTEVLSALESDFSIGDVVRVTLAPPPAPTVPVSASEPVFADKGKGEDTWVPAANKEVSTLSAATSPSIPVNRMNSAPKAVAKPAAPVAIKPAPLPVTKPAPKPAVAVAPAPEVAPVPKVEKALDASSNLGSNTAAKAKGSSPSRESKTFKSSKSAKKSGKKGGSKVKLKNRKPGKQRYGCPKF